MIEEDSTRTDDPVDHLVTRSRLAALIRRGKILDLGFSVVGLSLVIVSLSVLLVLFGRLFQDGAARLFRGHEVKANGFAPGLRELMGTLERGAVGESSWSLARDDYVLVPLDSTSGSTIPGDLEGKEVLALGTLPQPGVRELEISAVAPASGRPERLDRESVHGVLRRDGATWSIEPSPLPLDLSGLQGVEDLAGGRVVVDVGLSRAFPIKARSIEPLGFQSFLGSMPSRDAERAGVKSALVGSILVVLVTMLFAVPFGVAAGLYLEEYGRKNWFTAMIEINTANLAGVPSIVWGLMSLGLLVYLLGMGRSILTAGITLALLVLPIVIMATREAIRSIPQEVREASYACGASKWQTIRYHILPYSFGGILTGSIIGLSRAIGETAPLITIGALTYIAFLPDFSLSSPLAWMDSEFTVLPIQMFNWVSRPDFSFQANAAAAGIILLALTLSMNGVSIALRYRLRRKVRW